MDDIDLALLGALTRDGRRSWADLGREVGLTAPSVADRVARLERDGVVAGYRPVLTPSAVGLGVTALVGVFQREGTDTEDLIAALADVPAIEDCWFVAGEESVVLKVRVPDVDALEATLGVLRRTPGVARTRTTVVLSTRWEGRLPPLQA